MFCQREADLSRTSSMCCNIRAEDEERLSKLPKSFSKSDLSQRPARDDAQAQIGQATILVIWRARFCNE